MPRAPRVFVDGAGYDVNVRPGSGRAEPGEGQPLDHAGIGETTGARGVRVTRRRAGTAAWQVLSPVDRKW